MGDGKDAQLISKALPVIDQYIYVIEYYLSLQLATMRTSSKLLSVLLNVFNQLIEKGFCRPSEAEQDNSTGSTMQFQDNESGGLGDGDGGKDVSDQIENEDQLDSAKQQDQEEEEEEENDQSGMKEEENGIEMSEDFKADLQDKDKEEGKSDGESEDDDEQENLDKEMGETGEQADQLDEKLWGSDEEEGDEDEDDQDQEEGQGDAQKMESQMTAKNDDDDDEGNDDQNSKDNKKQQEPKLDEEDEENVNDDQTDPFHSTHEPPPAPEPLDVPDDLNLDGGDAGGDEDEPNETEEDPFDIDAAKNDDVPMDEQESNEQGDEKAGEEEQEMADESQEPESNQQGEDSTKEPAQESGDDDENEEEGKDKEMEESSENDNPAQTADPEQAVPSMDQPSEADAQPATEEAVKGSQDKIAKKQVEKMPQEDGGQNEEAANDETEGIGMAESRLTEGHDGQEQSKVYRQTLKKEE